MVEAKGLTEARKWFLAFPGTLRRRLNDALSSDEARQSVVSQATSIIDRVVYDAYTPDVYQRTYTFLGSVQSRTVQSKDEAGMEVFIPDRADLETEIEGLGDYIYPALMLPEFANLSYWFPKPKASLPRPFMDAWIDEFDVSSLNIVVRELDDLLSRVSL
jgi:hypothetical protein